MENRKHSDGLQSGGVRVVLPQQEQRGKVSLGRWDSSRGLNDERQVAVLQPG